MNYEQIFVGLDDRPENKVGKSVFVMVYDSNALGSYPCEVVHSHVKNVEELKSFVESLGTPIENNPSGLRMISVTKSVQ